MSTTFRVVFWAGGKSAEIFALMTWLRAQAYVSVPDWCMDWEPIRQQCVFTFVDFIFFQHDVQ